MVDYHQSNHLLQIARILRVHLEGNPTKWQKVRSAFTKQARKLEIREEVISPLWLVLRDFDWEPEDFFQGVESVEDVYDRLLDLFGVRLNEMADFLGEKRDPPRFLLEDEKIRKLLHRLSKKHWPAEEKPEESGALVLWAWKHKKDRGNVPYHTIGHLLLASRGDKAAEGVLDFVLRQSV